MSLSHDYLLRSLMFVPGHSDRLLTSASRSNADVLLIDLEDSVQPFENKQIARDKVEKYIKEGLFKDYLLFPRINDRLSGQLHKDIDQLTIEGVAGFMYPKAKTAGDIHFIDKLLETIEKEKGFALGTFKLIPLIETAAAVLNAQEIIQASQRVIAIAFGSEDFIQDLQGIHDHKGESLAVPRSMIAMAARANDVTPIDTVHIRVHDIEDLKENLRFVKNLGFEGMLVLHPKEIEYVHQYFSPTLEEVENAREMMRLNDEAQRNNMGVAIIGNKFVGPPMVSAAQQLLVRHEKVEVRSQQLKDRQS